MSSEHWKFIYCNLKQANICILFRHQSTINTHCHCNAFSFQVGQGLLTGILKKLRTEAPKSLLDKDDADIFPI